MSSKNGLIAQSFSAKYIVTNFILFRIMNPFINHFKIKLH